MQHLSLEQGANKVLRLTQRMLALAQENDWQAVAGLEQERQRSIDSLFRHPQLLQRMPTLVDILQQIVTLDKQCMALGEAARRQLADELNRRSDVGSALRIYQQHSSDALPG